MKMAAMRSLLVRAARHGRVATRAPLASAPSQAVASVLAHHFSSKGLNGLNGDHPDRDWDDDDAPLNGDVSPFERLLQHSQRFREQVEMEGAEEEDTISEELPENELVDEELHEDQAGKDDSEHSNDEDLDAVVDERESDHAEVVDQIRKAHAHHRSPVANKHEHHLHHGHTHGSKNTKRWSVEQRVRRQIGYADDVDFEHGLRDLDERRAREKMYVQLLARDYDRDRVCQNCGEPGHVARNCMLPVICSNCGDVGHRRNECPHRFYSIDQLAATKPMKNPETGRKMSESEAKAATRRKVELQAIRERHNRMKKAFDDELDEYLDNYERVKATRKDREEQD